MSFHVLPTEPALTDAEDICDYIAQDSPAQAALWYNDLVSRLESLAEHPERCPLAPEDGHLGVRVRHLIFGNYRVLFTLRNDTVLILHIRHGAREPYNP